jgi:hypothetical protein
MTTPDTPRPDPVDLEQFEGLPGGTPDHVTYLAALRKRGLNQLADLMELLPALIADLAETRRERDEAVGILDRICASMFIDDEQGNAEFIAALDTARALLRRMGRG